MIPADSISASSLVRGLVGVTSILLLCYLLSENRKAISWRIVIVGLILQAILGIGVVYIPFFYDLRNNLPF